MRTLALVLALGITTAGCASSDRADSVVVFAASSLTEVMAELANTYEQSHPAVTIELNIAGSSTLRAQLLEGAQADVVIVANQMVMSELVEQGIVESPVVAAGNRMVLAVPIANPGMVTGLADLADESLLVGLCDVQVPCGATARSILRSAGVTASLDTNEPDVRSLLAKIAAGELDAGIVYATDVTSAGQNVRSIEIDKSLYEPNPYPIAMLAVPENRDGAGEFIEFIMSAPGQNLFAMHGFLMASQVS